MNFYAGPYMIGVGTGSCFLDLKSAPARKTRFHLCEECVCVGLILLTTKYQIEGTV
jgi:hypothetical protein